jgi:hypothetical protein
MLKTLLIAASLLVTCPAFAGATFLFSYFDTGAVSGIGRVRIMPADADGRLQIAWAREICAPNGACKLSRFEQTVVVPPVMHDDRAKDDGDLLLGLTPELQMSVRGFAQKRAAEFELIMLRSGKPPLTAPLSVGIQTNVE